MENKQLVLDWTKVSEVELIYKTKVRATERPKITSSQDIFNLWQQIWNPLTIEVREEFKVLLLNRGNRVLGVYHARVGGTTGLR
jgi:DNA repair protein RadC